MQQRDVPLKRHQQINPPGAGQRLGIEHKQRRHLLGTGQRCS
jgi:hypothetical protein